MSDPPELPHDVGVLLLQLGTPDAPEAQAVRRYLAEFLSDPRVVDAPRWWWLPLLHGVILPSRSPKSAALYKKIWRADGLSPLLHSTAEVTRVMAQRLAPHGVRVGFAMRYGNPSIPSVVEEMLSDGVRRLLVFSLYPQYASSTTATGVDGVMAALAGRRDMPALRFAPSFFDHPAYLDALAASVREHGHDEAYTLFSFHGLPVRHVTEGDPYERECRATALGVAERLGLEAGRWGVAFQSRFGREAWLEPATVTEMAQLPARGVKRVRVLCPGFVADCLETLEEIAQANREMFLGAGGEAFHYLPCLNERGEWLRALEGLIRRELGGWMEGA